MSNLKIHYGKCKSWSAGAVLSHLNHSHKFAPDSSLTEYYRHMHTCELSGLRHLHFVIENLTNSVLSNYFYIYRLSH